MFSDAELQLALNSEVFLTKNRIIGLVYEQYGEIAQQLITIFESLRNKFPEALNILPKISKGENYEGLPWVMLDYPRHFGREEGHLAGRIFFWWGNYYLIQFQFSGKYLPGVLAMVNQNKIPAEISGYPLMVGFPEDIWNYQLPQTGLKQLEPEIDHFQSNSSEVFKIAISVPIGKYEDVKEVSLALGKLMVEHWPVD